MLDGTPSPTLHYVISGLYEDVFDLLRRMGVDPQAHVLRGLLIPVHLAEQTGNAVVCTLNKGVEDPGVGVGAIRIRVGGVRQAGAVVGC